MNKKTVSRILLTLLLIGKLAFAFYTQPVRSVTTWTVDDDGPADFKTIQTAIDAATLGDTIFVYNGTYFEQVVINKAVWLVGEHLESTIIDGGGSYGSVIRIGADNVKFAGFTVRECGRDYYLRAGIVISSSNNVVVGNKVVNNLNGFVVYGSSNNISGNRVTNNGDGIYVKDSSKNIIASNYVANNGDGIVLHGSSSNTILDNKVTENRYYGILLTWSSNDNMVFHNKIINNNPQARVFSSTNNNWDANYPSGGNYWSDYTGVDANGDGIGDTPYTSDGAYDRFPLMDLSIAPMADFTWLPEPPLAGKIVTFCPSGSFDPDGFIVGYRWDFGDSNANTTTTRFMTHVYTTPGTYTVNLTVTDNDDLSDSTTRPITVTVHATKEFHIVVDSIEYIVTIRSNSTISDFDFSQDNKLVSFNVAGTDGAVGFCTVTIPNALLGGPYVVLINHSPPITISEWTNSTHAFLYFTYSDSTKTVEIQGTTVVPEFSTWITILLLLIVISAALVMQRRKQLKAPIQYAHQTILDHTKAERDAHK